MAASFPLLSACERSATKVEAGIAAVSLDGAEIELEKAAIRELGESMTGPLILSGNPDYDVARTIWNAMHDRRPALIARCLNSTDVSNAVTFARERELLVSVRGGGHSFPGKSVCDGGLMIDLSMLDGVEVDAGNKRATAAGGALLGALDAATLEHGLVTTAGVVSHTGVGGYTLGGGFGRLNRMLGRRSTTWYRRNWSPQMAKSEPSVKRKILICSGPFGVAAVILVSRQNLSIDFTRLIAMCSVAVSSGRWTRQLKFWTSTVIGLKPFRTNSMSARSCSLCRTVNRYS